ncbi:MAG TPA: class I SAM-dependent methyltransferase [Bryobacterales bacterium]|nr:class I SAM-dependent methyltransferase [Bryobacterales bacterium]
MHPDTIDPSIRNNPRAQTVRLVSRGSKVLEVGCASGYMSEYLQRELGCDVTGVERDSEAAELARRKGIRVIVGDIEQDSTQQMITGQYDCALFTDVLEHLRNPSGVLAALSRRLTTGGTVISSIPNVAHWSVRWRLLVGRFDYSDGGLLDQDHIRFFTRKTAIETFHRAGFRVECLRIVHSFPRFLRLPDRLQEAFAQMAPGLLAYQFIIVARK